MLVSPGTRLGPYSVTVKIGEGGMCEVSRARDTRLDRPRVVTSCYVLLLLVACPSAAQRASSAPAVAPSTASFERIKRALAAPAPERLLDLEEYVFVTAEAPPDESLFRDFDFSYGLATRPSGGLYRYDLVSGAVALFRPVVKGVAGLFTGEEDPTPTVPPVLGQAERQLARAQIVGHPGVLNAAINQHGPTVTLALTVPAATTATAAHRLGLDFLRFVEQLRPSGSPEQVDSGQYDYIITVLTPTEAELARGGRPANAPRVTWRSR